MRQPHGGGGAARGRGRARSRLRRRDRRAAFGQARRADRQGLRPGHDRRDARAGAGERAQGRGDERRVPEGLHRGHPAPRRDRRRGHLELRHQPVDRQAEGRRRDVPRAPARRTARDQRRRRRERAGSRRPGRARELRRLHRRRALVRGVHAGAVACRLHRDLDRAHPRACRPDVRQRSCRRTRDGRERRAPAGGVVRLRAQRRAEPDGGGAARASRRPGGSSSARRGARRPTRSTRPSWR